MDKKAAPPTKEKEGEDSNTSKEGDGKVRGWSNPSGLPGPSSKIYAAYPGQAGQDEEIADKGDKHLEKRTPKDWRTASPPPAAAARVSMKEDKNFGQRKLRSHTVETVPPILAARKRDAISGNSDIHNILWKDPPPLNRTNRLDEPLDMALQKKEKNNRSGHVEVPTYDDPFHSNFFDNGFATGNGLSGGKRRHSKHSLGSDVSSLDISTDTAQESRGGVEIQAVHPESSPDAYPSLLSDEQRTTASRTDLSDQEMVRSNIDCGINTNDTEVGPATVTAYAVDEDELRNEARTIFRGMLEDARVVEGEPVLLSESDYPPMEREGLGKTQRNLLLIGIFVLVSATMISIAYTRGFHQTTTPRPHYANGCSAFDCWVELGPGVAGMQLKGRFGRRVGLAAGGARFVVSAMNEANTRGENKSGAVRVYDVVEESQTNSTTAEGEKNVSFIQVGQTIYGSVTEDKGCSFKRWVASRHWRPLWQRHWCVEEYGAGSGVRASAARARY